MNAGSYSANTNCIVPELVKIIDLFDNAVGDRDNSNPDDIVFLENIINVLQQKRKKMVGDLVTLTVHTNF